MLIFFDANRQITFCKRSIKTALTPLFSKPLFSSSWRRSTTRKSVSFLPPNKTLAMFLHVVQREQRPEWISRMMYLRNALWENDHTGNFTRWITNDHGNIRRSQAQRLPCHSNENKMAAFPFHFWQTKLQFVLLYNGPGGWLSKYWICWQFAKKLFHSVAET